MTFGVHLSPVHPEAVRCHKGKEEMSETKKRKINMNDPLQVLASRLPSDQPYLRKPLNLAMR
jgi:hypothetical protein